MTTKPSVGVFGDSRELGQGDISNAAGLTGTVMRALGEQIAVMNVSAASDRVSWWNNNNTRRKARMARCSHIVLGDRFNDLNGGGMTAAAVMTADQAMIATA